MHRSTMVAFLSALALLAATGAVAATRYVSLTGASVPPYTTPENAAQSIQDAVDISSDGDTILVLEGTYTPPAQIVVWRAITIRGLFGPEKTIVNSGGAHRGFFIQNMDAVIEALTISNGAASAGGGVLCYYGGMVKDCIVVGNTAVTGGGVDCNSYGRAVNCVIRDNTATDVGGGGACSGNVLGGFIDCLIINNVATNGGGVSAFNTAVESCTIVDNFAVEDGGGAFLWSNGWVNSCVVSNNAAGRWGGGAFFYSHGSARDTVFADNWAPQGGGMALTDTYVSSCTFVGNQAVSGGGYISFSNAYVNACVFKGNQAASGGGAFLNSIDSVMRNCILYENIAVTGGAVYTSLLNVSNVTVENCTIYGNTGTFGGGTAAIEGGKYLNCIVYSNTALYSGANWFFHGDGIGFTNCCTTPPPHPAYGTGNISANPGLVNPAAGDFHIIRASPCIDAGLNDKWMIAGTDADGNRRLIHNTVDIGAYEFQPPRAPLNLQATDGEFEDRVVVSWSGSESALGYRVYRNVTNDVASVLQISDDLIDLSYQDTNVVPGELYYYWVGSFNDLGPSEFSSNDTGYARLAAPTGLNATDGIYSNYVELTWTAPTGAIGFIVLRNTNSDVSAASTIGTPTNTLFRDGLVVPGRIFHYWVRAIAHAGTSEPSEPDTGFAGLPAPPGFSATDGTYTDRVELVWSEVQNAVSYSIFRSETNDYPFGPLLTTVTVTSYTDTAAVPGRLYYYWVRALASDTLGQPSKLDTGFAFLVTPYNVSASDGTFADRVRVSWPAIAGATVYHVYRNSSNDLNTAYPLGTSAIGMYEDMSVQPYETNYYWVRASAPACTTPFSNSDPGFASLAAPLDVAASDGVYTNLIDIVWSPVAAAESYMLYRGTSSMVAAAVEIAATTATGFADTNITAGEIYYYWVRSVSGTGVSPFGNDDIGFATLAASAMKWKFKDASNLDKVNGKKLTPNLGPYFERGYKIAIADDTFTNIFDGPHALLPNSKHRKWSLKMKRNTIILYKVKPSRLQYTLYRTMLWPAAIVIVPPLPAAGAAAQYTQPFGIPLPRGEAAATGQTRRVIHSFPLPRRSPENPQFEPL